MSKEYDLIVLGSGGAGYQVATKTKSAGWNVAVINQGPFGGTCAVRGCIPKKVLSGTAQIADILNRLHELGISEESSSFSWAKTIAFKRKFTDSVPGNTKKSLMEAGIDVYEGSPSFTDNLKIDVNNQELSAGKVHIAVGAKPLSLPIEGAEHLITSDDFMELNDLPRRIVFIGGGFVSFEFAHVAARFNVEVTVLHVDDKPLAAFDQDIIKQFIEASRKAGIKVCLNAAATKIEKTENGYTTTDTAGNKYESDLVVNGAGRIPAIDKLDLEKTGVEYDARKGIKVNEFLRSTSNSDVYAAGDVADAGLPLSSVAGVQGSIVANNLLGRQQAQPDYLSTPSVVFTTPTIAKVGYLEQDAKDRGYDVDVVVSDTSQWFDSKRMNQKYSMSKVLIDKKTNQILGAHLLGDSADNNINVFAIAIENKLTTKQLEAPILAFPTSSDDIRSMF